MTLPNGAEIYTNTIRTRPWWFWALAGLWLLVEVLLLQTALASVEEGEVRAAAISWIAATVLAAAGVLAWLHRGRPHRLGESKGQH